MNDFVKSASILKSLNEASSVRTTTSVQRTGTRSTEKIHQDARLEKSFGEVLQKVKFSKHAVSRLDTRDISLSEQDLSRIEKGIGLAKEKGVKQTLIMMDDKVFIASAKNNTIITAATDGKLKDKVFTNIDGAVIV